MYSEVVLTNTTIEVSYLYLALIIHCNFFSVQDVSPTIYYTLDYTTTATTDVITTTTTMYTAMYATMYTTT